MRLFWGGCRQWTERSGGQEALGTFKISGLKSCWAPAAVGLMMMVVSCHDEFNFPRKLIDVPALTQEVQELNNDSLVGGEVLPCQQAVQASSADENPVAVKVAGDGGDGSCFSLVLSHHSDLASGGDKFDVVPSLLQGDQGYEIEVFWRESKEDAENSSAVDYEYKLWRPSATSDGDWLPLTGRGYQRLPTQLALSDSAALVIRKVDQSQKLTGQAYVLLSYNQGEEKFEIQNQELSEEMLASAAGRSAEPFQFFTQSGPSRITVSWDLDSQSSSVVDLEYRIDNDIEWHSMGLESPFVIENLKPSQLYELWLRVVYEDGFSEGGSVKLTTLAEDFIGDADVGSEAEALVFSLIPKEMSIIVNWKAPRWFDASKVEDYEYRLMEGESEWISMGLSGFYEIKELQPGATHVMEFRVIYTDGPGDSVKTSVKTQGVSEGASDP